MQGWEHFHERAQWNAIPWGFPQVWNYSRDIWHARNPWKQKRQLTQPPNQPRKWTKHGKTNGNQTYTHASCWKEDGRHRKEECKAGNTSRREPSGMPFGTTTQPAQKMDKSCQNQWQPNIHTCFLHVKIEEIERKNARLGTLPGESPVECHLGKKKQLTQPPNQPRKWTKHDKTNDNQTYTHMLLAEKKIEEIERKNARLGTLPGDSPVECHLGGKKSSWHNHPTSPENGQNLTKPMTTKHTHMLLSEKKMEEIERKNARLGTLREPSGMPGAPGGGAKSPLQLEMARFDKTEKTERFVNQTETARSLMNLILETTSAVKAFKGAGNTFIKLPAVAINASIKDYFEIIVWHLTPRKIIIFMGSDPGEIIPSPKIILAWFDLRRKYMVLAWNWFFFCKIILVRHSPLK